LDHFVYLSCYRKRELSGTGKYQITILFLTQMINVQEIFQAAQLAPIFSFPDS
jgi:hypothetical protein